MRFDSGACGAQRIPVLYANVHYAVSQISVPELCANPCLTPKPNTIRNLNKLNHDEHLHLWACVAQLRHEILTTVLELTLCAAPVDELDGGDVAIATHLHRVWRTGATTLWTRF